MDNLYTGCHLDIYYDIYSHKGVGGITAGHIDSFLFSSQCGLCGRFNETFDGVVLAYDVDVRRKKAKILPGTHPYFGVKLTAKLLLFHPKPDMLLEGKVLKLGQQSIHVIVLGFSAAVITEEDIREEFKYKVKRDQEVFVSTSHKQHKIKVGTILRFLAKSFDEEILHISGSLLPARTGSVKWLTKTVDEWSHAVRASTKRKMRADRKCRSMRSEWLFLNADHKHKKSKRQRSEYP